METGICIMKTKKIIVVLTNKGYAAIEHSQIFNLWKNKFLNEINKEIIPVKVLLDEMNLS